MGIEGGGPLKVRELKYVEWQEKMKMESERREKWKCYVAQRRMYSD